MSVTRGPFLRAIEFKLRQTNWARGGISHRAATVAQIRAGARKLLEQVYSEQRREARKAA